MILLTRMLLPAVLFGLIITAPPHEKSCKVRLR